ncbi:hypothetical protein BGZ98_006845 [Dissophora globulifera]|nr:hypothetical protein BGZ98_006845 [Dissophora globulifera]
MLTIFCCLLLCLLACHLGIISRVHRRLSDIERQCVRSGSVYCFDEREAGMRRWTDGKSWSPSRVTGSFLTYRELDDSQGAGSKNVYRPDGLLKQSFSITTADKKKLHLISYYTNEDLTAERLFLTPSRDPRFAQVVIPKGIYPETSPSADAHSHASTSNASPSPPARSRHRPHHRSFHNNDDGKVDIPRRPEPPALALGHHRTHSGSVGLKEHRYSPIQATFQGSRSRSGSHNVGYSSHMYSGSYETDKHYQSSSPSATSSFPTPPLNSYSPTASWASEDDQLFVPDVVSPESLADGSVKVDDMASVMIPALRELPLLATNFDHRKVEHYAPTVTSSSSSEQDSLSVLANLATDTLLLPKLEPQEIKRERARWVEDDRQLRALSSMLRL